MDTVRLTQIGLAVLLVIVAVANIYRVRVYYPSKTRYGAMVAGTVGGLAGSAAAEAYVRFGHDARFLDAGVVLVVPGVALFVWGLKGMVRPDAQ